MANYSVYAIPVYYVHTLYSHVYATRILKKANNGQGNNANPRSVVWKENVKKAVPASTYARYERAEAAHANGMENLPLFMGAIILGNMAKLPASTLNAVAATFLALRFGYTFAYINTESASKSFIRSGLWALSTVSLMYLMVSAGNVLA